MRNLKYIVSAAAVASALVGITAATAADLPARTYTKAPVYVEPVFNWTGFYIGGNIGYSWGRSANTATLSDLRTGAIFATATSRNDVNGVIGGGQFGYNWQMSNWVAGIEADLQGSGERGSTNFTCVGCSDFGGDITSTLTQKLSWFGTLRGRAGVLVTPTVLLYGTGGLAFGEVDTAGSITGSTGNALATILFPGVNNTQVGWTAGAGIEAQIAGNWTMKFEYLYMDLGTVSAGPITATGILATGRIPVAASYSAHFTDNIVRVGFNYLLNSPVVAKY
ncbi:MAG: outer membrane protein [Bradyrhizobium sp.]